MLEGYKPIDFSSIFPPMELGEMRNRVGLTQGALEILANSRWNKTPITQLWEEGLKVTPEGTPEVPTRKQTFVGRVIDFFSTPAYAIANALDDAVAGHQSDVNDSILSDIGQIAGGLVTGAGRGLLAGLKGTFGSNQAAADPTDKIYLGNVLVRLDTGMSLEEAMKPENREIVRERLKEKRINLLSDAPEDKYFYNFEKGIVEVTDEDIDEYFKTMHLAGLGASMVGDPLNFIKGPTGIFSGVKGTAEVPEITGVVKEFKTARAFDEINKGDPKTVNFGPLAKGKQDGSYKVVLPPSAVQNRIFTQSGKLTPSWFTFPPNPVRTSTPPPSSTRSILPVIDDTPELPQIALSPRKEPPIARTTEKSRAGLPKKPGSGLFDDIRTSFGAATPETAEGIHFILRELDESPIEITKTAEGFKPKEGIIPTPRVPDDQIKIAETLSKPENVRKLVKDLLSRAAKGERGWQYNLINRLKTKYGVDIPFPNLYRLIDHVSKIPDFPKRIGIPAENAKIVKAFEDAISRDVTAMKLPPKVKPAEDIINQATTAGPVNIIKLIEDAKNAGKVSARKSKNPARDAKIVDDVVKQFEPQLSLSQIPPGVRDPEAYKKALRSHGTFTGPKQVNIWNALTSKYLVKLKSPARFTKALDLLRQIEDRFIAMGYVPMSSAPKLGNSIPLRLSQVIDAIGPQAAAMSPSLLTKILRGEPEALAKLPAEAVQKIEKYKAGEALVDAAPMIRAIDETSKRIEDLAKEPISAARLEEVVTIESKVAEDIAKAAGASPVAAKTASQAVKSSFIFKSPIDEAIKSSTLNTTVLLSHPNVSPKMLKQYSNGPAVARAINQAIGGPKLRQLGKMWGPAAKAFEYLGGRFNAAYKNADMRPIYLRNAVTARSTVAKRAQYLNNLAKKYSRNDVDLWNEALKAAQGRITPVPGSKAEELSKEIFKVMESLFGSSGLKTSVALENTVVGRAQLLMKELNHNLKRFGLGQYQFTNKGEYAEGVKWLNSWESWQIDKPLEFLFKIQNVVEFTVREKIMFDEIVARFATKSPIGEFKYKVNHPRLAGYYFGKEAAKQAEQFVKVLKDISSPTKSKTLQYFDKVLSKWKASVTIYIPAHHIRNLIGDVYFNWIAGVNSTRPYEIALKVMQSQKGRYQDLKQIEALTNPNALRRVIEKGSLPGPAGKQTAFTMKNGTQVTNDMVYVSAFQQGILPSARVLEDIPDDLVTGIDRIGLPGKLRGKGQHVAHTISEGRDHYVRLAHYIDALKKSNKPFEQAVEEAAAVVRKWHPDGMDLTKFERNVMRRIFPFYSWTRKAIPLIIESAVATPGKIMAYPKAQYFLQQALGIEAGPMSDPFPYDRLFPDWIREKGIGPISGPEGLLTRTLTSTGGVPGYSVFNPSNPTLDILSQLGHPGKMAMGMANPAARIPIEIATGRDTQTGAEISPTDPDYIIKQIPGLSHIGRATGEFGVSDTVKENSSGVNLTNIANLLFAAGVVNAGPYWKSAEFDLRDYLRSLR